MTRTTDEIMTEEAHNLLKIEDEMRDVHGEPVFEDENVIIFSDSSGHELGEIADHTDGVSRDDVSGWMHEIARQYYDRTSSGGDAWSVNDPVVLLKWNEGQNPHLSEE